MGEEMGSLFGLLCKELWTLNNEVSTFVGLFSQSTEVNLLNESAPEFFGAVQRLLYDSIALRIARLSDPATSNRGQQANLTVSNLVETIRTSACVSPNDLKRISEVLAKVKEAAEPFKLWRNKVIAHSDLQHATQGFPDLVTSEQVDKAVFQIKLLLLFTGNIYSISTSQRGTTDVGSLLKHLRAAKPEIERQRKIEDEIIGF
jgi:hypothetical protein